MESTTILLATIWGSFLIIAASIFLALPSFKYSFVDVFKPRRMRLSAAFLSCLIGFISIYYHNIWEPDIQGLITIFGWAALIKGILIVTFPSVLNISESIAKKKWFNYYLIIIICLGCYLLTWSLRTPLHT